MTGIMCAYYAVFFTWWHRQMRCWARWRKPWYIPGYFEKTDAHLPMIHIAFSNLKTWMMGTHHGVSQKHLPAYLDEFVFRFSRRFYPMTAFASVLGIGMNVVGPTYRGLYDGKWDHCSHSSSVNLL